jgi:hypothetical protein
MSIMRHVLIAIAGLAAVDLARAADARDPATLTSEIVMTLRWGNSPSEIGRRTTPDTTYGAEGLVVDEERETIYVLDAVNRRVLSFSFGGQLRRTIPLDHEAIAIALRPTHAPTHGVVTLDRLAPIIRCVQEDGRSCGELPVGHDLVLLRIDPITKNLRALQADGSSYEVNAASTRVSAGQPVAANGGVAVSAEPLLLRRDKKRSIGEDTPGLRALDVEALEHAIASVLYLGTSAKNHVHVVADEIAHDGSVFRSIRQYDRDGSLAAYGLIPTSDFANPHDDLYVTPSGTVYQLLLLANGVDLLRWREGKASPLPVGSAMVRWYPEGHHEYAQETTTVRAYSLPLTSTAITQSSVLTRAAAYANKSFSVSAANISPSGGSNQAIGCSPWTKLVETPIRSTGTQVGVPYKWGGTTGLSGVTSDTDCSVYFDAGLAQAKFAGDINTDTGCGSCAAVGVDCSGFVSQTWGLPAGSRIATSTIASSSYVCSAPLPALADLLPGDVISVNTPNVRQHMRLLEHRQVGGTYDGRFFFYESATGSNTNNRVGMKTGGYPLSELQSHAYTAYRKRAIAGLFNNGDRVIALQSFNVRPCASTTQCQPSDTVPAGEQGTILPDAAMEADGWLWWRVDWDTKTTGWSTQCWFGKTASSSPTPSVTLTSRDVSPLVVTVNQSFTVTTQLRVDSATADHAGISVSFPSLTVAGTSSASYNSSQGTVSTSTVSSGATQIYNDNYPLHLLAEADWSNVSAGSTKNFNLTVTPKQTGTFVVRIRGWVTTNGYNNPKRDPSSGTLDQQGYPVYETTVNVTSSSTRLIRLEGDLAFGDVTVGSTVNRTLTIFNDGNATLNVSGISYPSGFSGAWSGTISAGGAKTVSVTFSPSSATTYGSTITVNSDKTSGTNTISCSGRGVSASSTRIVRLSGDLSFGTVTVGQTSTRQLTINNDGNATLTVSSITYTSGFSGDWNGGTIGPGSSKAVNVTFAPPTGTTYNGTVTVNSDKTSGTNTTTCSGAGAVGGQATYDPVLKAPKCASVASTCDSGSLLLGRAGLGPEPNAPNTIGNSCGDGIEGTYHADESNDRLSITSTDAGAFAPGKSIRIEATVWAYDSSDILDIYYTADAQNANWVWIATFGIGGSGSQTLATTYTIPVGAALHAVRANFRYQGSPSSCTNGDYDDHDDLVFAVNNAAPGVTVTPTSGLTTTEEGQNAQFTVALTTPPSANVAIGLSSSDTTEGTVTPTSLTFTTSNWSTPQTVTVHGVNDATHDGNIAFTIVTASATSTDATYNGLNPADVAVVNIDNDPLATPFVTAAFNGSSVGISWPVIPEAANYEVQRSYNAGAYTQLSLGPGAGTTDTGCPAMATCVYRVRALDAVGVASGWATDLATTITFIDFSLTSTRIKAVHFTQLRAAVNSVRAAAGRPAAIFTGTISFGTVVTGMHLRELRTALDEARTTLGLLALSYTNPANDGSLIRAADVLELRSGVQ